MCKNKKDLLWNCSKNLNNPNIYQKRNGLISYIILPWNILWLAQTVFGPLSSSLEGSPLQIFYAKNVSYRKACIIWFHFRKQRKSTNIWYKCYGFEHKSRWGRMYIVMMGFEGTVGKSVIFYTVYSKLFIYLRRYTERWLEGKRKGNSTSIYCNACNGGGYTELKPWNGRTPHPWASPWSPRLALAGSWWQKAELGVKPPHCLLLVWEFWIFPLSSNYLKLKNIQ